MRLESLLIGVIVLGFGVFLVASGGTVGGVSLPGLIGLQCNTPSNSTTPSFSPGCPGGFGYGIGTVVCIFGLGMIGNGLRAPSAPKGMAGAGGFVMPPEMAATMAAARQQMELMGRTHGGGATGPVPPGTRFCPECGRSNASDAGFCQRCGKPMPPPATTSPPPA
ncbi:MAG: zinc-ribbon domain-containing protein [Candidatus Lutacidiplasmatales archaeon]